MKIRLIRHATMQIQIGDVRLLVDPMLADAYSMPPVDNSPNQENNPLVPLPVKLDSLMEADGVLLTHMHRDHFDAATIEKLPKSMPVLCPAGDEGLLSSLGFNNIQPIDKMTDWKGLTIYRAGGRHGRGEIGKKMGPVSGYVLQFGAESLYICGDTIWCEEVEQTLEKYQPQVTIVFAGAAQFISGGPITMDCADIAFLCAACPGTTVVAVHMEAFNHCLLRRRDLQEFLTDKGLKDQVQIPQDGEELCWTPF